MAFYQQGTSANQGPIRGFQRSPNGALQTLINTRDVEDPSDPFGGVTEVLGVNDLGVAVGTYWDKAAGHYAGYFHFNGTYVTYNVPGYTNTSVAGINNDVTDFVGWVQSFPNNQLLTSAFVSDHGHLTVFSVPGSTFTEALSINNLDQAIGVYSDSNGVYHGFLRTATGTLIYPIDVPGASTTKGLGTDVLGINDCGTMSGHYWDASNNEHGFVLNLSNQFTQIDIPHAIQTSGGGLNNFGVVIGHWVDKNGNQIGYIAIPDND